MSSINANNILGLLAILIIPYTLYPDLYPQSVRNFLQGNDMKRDLIKWFAVFVLFWQLFDKNVSKALQSVIVLFILFWVIKQTEGNSSKKKSTKRQYQHGRELFYEYR